MAMAKLVCGDCKAEIAASDVYCPSCGAKIETPSGDAVVCAVCGHRNRGRGEFCESCGARVSGGAPAARPAGKREAQKQQKQGPAGKTRPFEPWQVISVVAVVGLVAYLVVTEVMKSPPRSSGGGAVSAPAPGSGMPGAGPLFAPPAAAAVDLTPFEAAVKAQPADAGAQLRLANALHDNRMMPRAVEAYKKYLAMRPKDPDARTDMGICYFQMAQTDTVNMMGLLEIAAREMLTVQQGSPKHQPSAFNLGVVYLHMGRMEESNTWFRKAVELNKDSDLGTRAANILKQNGSVAP
jgi:hypothetical protein